MKIAVYAICQNEEKQVARWLNSVREADGIFVLHLGSDDQTFAAFVSHPMKYKVQLHEAHIKPFRFDVARNTALALVPKDYDICICLDMDERLTPGWRSRVVTAWKAIKNCNVATCALQHSPSYIFQTNTRIHSRFGWTWRFPCHEAIYEHGIEKRQTLIDGRPLIAHLREEHKQSRLQYLDLLDLAVKENPQSRRAVHYYGRELYYRGHYGAAVQWLMRYLELPAEAYHPVEEQENAAVLKDAITQLQRCKNE